jgi:ankyrin repeat protein
MMSLSQLPKFYSAFKIPPQSGWSALHIAGEKDLYAIAEMLIIKGAQVNLATNGGLAALHMVLLQHYRSQTHQISS